MRHNESHEELAALAALSALEGEAAAAFEAHLAEGCARCEEILADLKVASTALAAAAPPVPPREGLRGEILAGLERRATRVAAAPLRRPSSAGVAWLFAAAASLVLLFLGLDDARLRREREELASRTSQLAARLKGAERELARRDLRVKVLESEDIRILFLSGTGPQPQARARVFWSEKAKRGILLAGNLRPLTADQQYELWVFDRGKPVAAGVFDVDAEGRALFESPDLSAISAAQNFAVTVEPRGGLPAPSGPIVLLGAT
ncbi:MAG: anti-sigma factor [Thermoanaerobaculia bacterium]